MDKGRKKKKGIRNGYPVVISPGLEPGTLSLED